MATDKFTKLKELTLKRPDKGILSFKADGAIAMWAPVILVAPPAGESLPRITTTTTTNDPLIIGIAAGGSGDVAGTGNAADAAGDMVDVIPLNSGAMTKCKVDGAVGGNIVIGESLISDATAGQAEPADTVVATANAFVLCKALQPSTVNGDTILVIMVGSQ